MMPRRTLVTLAALAAGPHAGAHARVEAAARGDGFELVVVALLIAAALAYGVGAHRLAVRRGVRANGQRRDLACFAAGLAVLAGTLLGPLDAAAGRSFALHMVQHEALMLLAAPLLVLGRPLAHWSWAVPRPRRHALRRVATRARALGVWRACTGVTGASVLQALALWAWHLPAWFDAALAHAGVHVLQHLTFLAAALCFWWSVLRPGPARVTAPPAIAALFVTTIATGALGALLTFASTPWYAGAAPPPWQLSALEDQQLGGLIMWIPGGTAYMIVALLLAGRVLRPSTGRLRVRGAH